MEMIKDRRVCQGNEKKYESLSVKLLEI